MPMPRISRRSCKPLLCALMRQVRPPDSEHPEGQVLGDPTEAALIVAAEKLGLEHAALVDAFPRVDEFPFDSLRKRMTTVHRQPDGYLVVCKGAPEFLLHSDVVSAEDALLKAALAKAHEYAAWDCVFSRWRPGIPAPAGFGCRSRKQPAATGLGWHCRSG